MEAAEQSVINGVDTNASPTTTIQPSFRPIQLSFPLPRSSGTNIYIHLSYLSKALMVFMTTAPSSVGGSRSMSSLGSFVHAIPDRTNPPNVLATPLYTQESSLDFAMRVARLLARKVQMPVYVGNSISFASMGLGGTVEEEMEGMKTCVEVIMEALEKAKNEHQAPA